MNNAILSTCVPNEEQMQLAKREAENFIKNQKSDFKKLNDNVEENKKTIEKTGDKIEKCGQQKIEDIKGKSFLNLVTGDVLKTALVDLTQDQLTSIYKPLLDLLDITNRNLETISKINQGIMALQFIMAYQVVANTKVETERAERISQLSEKIKNGNITLEELIDLASETSELQEKRAIEINNSLQKLSDENTTIKKRLELKIKEEDERNELLARQVNEYHNDVLGKIRDTNNTIDGIKERLELRIKEANEKNEAYFDQLKSVSDAYENRLNKLEKRSFFDSVLYKVFIGVAALCALILSFLTLCG